MTSRRRDTRPHGILECIFKVRKILFVRISLQPRPVDLLKIQTAVFLDGQVYAVVGEQIRIIAALLDINEKRNFTRRAVRKHPILPVVVVWHETPAHFYSIRPDGVQNIRLDNGELLNHVVDIDITGRNTQCLLQLCVSNCRNAARPVSAKIDRNKIRLLMIECTSNSFAGCHYILL